MPPSLAGDRPHHRPRVNGVELLQGRSGVVLARYLITCLIVLAAVYVALAKLAACDLRTLRDSEPKT